MVKAIYCKNFQSLHNVSLLLGKLTVVVGDTNVGKSALMRAVRAAVENRRGDSFVFTGESDCQVSIHTGKVIVTWYKPYKKSGLYYVSPGDNPSGMREISHSAALEHLGLSRVELSKQVNLMVNFQNQLDAPFLLAESDVTKSKVLGEITNASLVLISVNQIKRWALSNSSLYNIRLQDIANTRNSLFRYKALDSIFNDLHELEELVDWAEVQTTKLAKLEDLANRLREAVLSLTALSDLVNKTKVVAAKLDSTYFGSLKIHVDAERLQKFTARLESLTSELASAKLIHRKVSIIQEHLPDTTRVEQVMNQLTVLCGYFDAISSNKQTIARLEDEAERVEKALELSDSDLHIMRVELKVCPLCEAPLIAEHTHENGNVT